MKIIKTFEQFIHYVDNENEPTDLNSDIQPQEKIKTKEEIQKEEEEAVERLTAGFLSKPITQA